MELLHPAIVKVWRIKLIIATAVVGILVFGYELGTFLLDGDAMAPFGVWTGIVLAIGFLWSFWAPRIRYRHWRYELRPEDLYIEQGLFTRVQTVVPLLRAQHLDVVQDIIEREYDMARLVIHTAGTQANSIVLPGLPKKEAERLRDDVKAFIIEDAV